MRTNPPRLAIGWRLELFLPDQTELACTVEVVWWTICRKDHRRATTLGVKFVFIHPVDRERLQTVLKPE